MEFRRDQSAGCRVRESCGGVARTKKYLSGGQPGIEFLWPVDDEEGGNGENVHETVAEGHVPVAVVTGVEVDVGAVRSSLIGTQADKVDHGVEGETGEAAEKKEGVLD